MLDDLNIDGEPGNNFPDIYEYTFDSIKIIRIIIDILDYQERGGRYYEGL